MIGRGPFESVPNTDTLNLGLSSHLPIDPGPIEYFSFRKFKSLLNNFKAALSTQRAEIIKTIWDNNPLLQIWFSAQTVDFGPDQSGQSDLHTISLDELIYYFKSALSSYDSYVIKAMWDSSPVLQAWSSGQAVDFATDPSGPSDLRCISPDELIENFKSALSSYNTYVIKAMWNSSPLLQAWFSGQPVDFATDPSGQHDFRTISLDELIHNFKYALSSKAHCVSKTIWNSSPLLQAWFSGQPVDFATDPSGQHDFRTISLDELLRSFKSALSGHAPYVNKPMWDNNPLLRAWFSGQTAGVDQEDQSEGFISLNELIQYFKSALSSFYNGYVIKAMWDSNSLLRAWFSGQTVDFGLDQFGHHDFDHISVDELIDNFELILSSYNPYVIKAMWDSSPLLQAWFSGKTVDFAFDPSGPHDFRTISLDELIQNFKCALSSHTSCVIKAMWDSSPLLQAWFSGKTVDFAFDPSGQHDFRTISLDELIQNFKCALSSHTSYVIKAMWDSSPLLQAWFSGKTVDFAFDPSGQHDFRTISLEELIQNFKCALSSHTSYVIKAMWDSSPLLQAWFSGKTVDFAFDPSGQHDFRTISLDELIQNFKCALSSQTSYVIKAMWDSSPLLQAWFSGKTLDFGPDLFGQPDLRTISVDELIHNFKSALSSQTQYVPQAMWESSPLLQAWFSGQTVDFAPVQSGQHDFRTISLDGLINIFKSALSSQRTAIIEVMWESNTLLQAWLCGQPVNFGQDQSGHSNLCTISLDECTHYFKSVLSSRSKKIIEAMWKNNTLLQAWFSGQPVNFYIDSSSMPSVHVISLDELINNFKCVLNSQTSYVSKVMWDNSPLLQAWFSGLSVNFGPDNEHPDWRSISFDILINNFKSVLSSQITSIIKAMYDNNVRLNEAIRECTFDQSIKLLKKVMSSSKLGKSEFIIQFVNRVDNVDIINAVLESIKKSIGNKSVTYYRTNQITILTQRLEQLMRPNSNDAMIDNVTLETTVPTQNITKRKKTNSAPKLAKYPKKIKEVEITYFHAIAKKLPSELDNKKHFFVDTQLGKDLQIIDPHILKDKTSIKSVRKVKEKEIYKVTIADQAIYDAFLKSHTHPSAEESHPPQTMAIVNDNGGTNNVVVPHNDVSRDIDILEDEDQLFNSEIPIDNVFIDGNPEPPNQASEFFTVTSPRNPTALYQANAALTLFGHPFLPQNLNQEEARAFGEDEVLSALQNTTSHN